MLFLLLLGFGSLGDVVVGQPLLAALDANHRLGLLPVAQRLSPLLVSALDLVLAQHLQAQPLLLSRLLLQRLLLLLEVLAGLLQLR